MLVVLDTNIWREELALNSKAGAALRFYLRERNAKLVVPEVVRLETRKALRSICREWVSRIDGQHRQLLAVFGELKAIVLPTEEEIERRIDSVFTGIGVDILDAPFTLESARSSFLKVIHCEPPSGERDQQFKDGVLWADCCKLLDGDEVILVTKDRGFYQDKDSAKGLASNLLKEIEHKKNKLRVLSTIADLLEAVRVEVTIPGSALALTILQQKQHDFFPLLAKHQFAPRKSLSIQQSLFGTENPARVYVTFEMSIDCRKSTDDLEVDGVLRMSGDATFDVTSKSFNEIQIRRVELNHKNPDGTDAKHSIIIGLVGTAYLGHRSETHKLTFPLTPSSGYSLSPDE